jgi:ribosomal protein L11 methyltransferase
MEKQTYFKVRVKKIPSSLESEMTELSFEFGCSGISEALSYVQKDLVYDPEIRPMRFRDVDVFFSERPSNAFFESLKELSQEIDWEISEEVQKDWLEEWKKGFKPFQLVGPFWVVPSWFEPPAEAQIPLLIDPGMAFGTGTHATTQMAAALVHRVLKKKAPAATEFTAIDVGTGTAILAMLAKISGADRVVGIDIDPEAQRVARENVQRNKVEKVEIPELLLEEVRESFDLVIANIIDGVLLKLKDDLCRVLKHKGHLILTGVLEERENQFIDQFLKDTDLKIDLRLAKDEWVGYLLSARNG